MIFAMNSLNVLLLTHSTYTPPLAYLRLTALASRSGLYLLVQKHPKVKPPALQTSENPVTLQNGGMAALVQSGH